MVLVLVVHLGGHGIAWVVGAGLGGGAPDRLPMLPLWLALPTRPVLPALGEVGTSVVRVWVCRTVGAVPARA